VHDREDVESILSDLNDSPVAWILMRNSNDEIPDRLPLGKDIDILLRFEDCRRIHSFFAERGYRRVRHPHRQADCLYGLDRPRMYRSKTGVLVDVNFQLFVESLDAGQLFPLDQTLQESAWEQASSRQIGSHTVPVLGNEDVLVLNIARGIFDKRQFSDWDQEHLGTLLRSSDLSAIYSKLELVFFGATNLVIDHIMRGRYDTIVSSYFAYAEY